MVNGEKIHKYADDHPSLSLDVPPPSYEMILDWMKRGEGRAVSFDIWARGNYMKRVINNSRSGVSPLIVPFQKLDEMRWAYRRLALIGLPVDFVYMGGVTEPKKILHLYPADGVVNEGGWGYIGALGSIAKIRGRKWFPVIGYSQLMPEVFLDWITEEASDAFLKGDLFIAPAELIGIDPHKSEPGIQALEEVILGRRFARQAQSGAMLMQLELPYLDEMTPRAFQKFLSEHENELIRFRSAFKKLVVGVSQKDLTTIIEELRSEIAELSLSERCASIRKDIIKLGGIMSTFSAAIAATAATVPEKLLPVATAAGAAAATTALIEFWKQRTENKEKLRKSPYFLMWALGVDKASKVRRSNVNIEFQKYQRILDEKPHNLSDFHWLCSPKPGLRFAAVKK